MGISDYRSVASVEGDNYLAAQPLAAVGNDQPNSDQPGSVQPSTAQPGSVQPRTAQPDSAQPSTDQPDSANSLQRRGVPGRGVPENWFVDPVRLGVPGVRRSSVDDAEVLSWQADSLCAQTDPEAFFPEKGGSTREAKKICGSCEVRSNCLEYALENDERFGIWGGLSERERRKLRKRA